jgi:hypothetical protein
MLLSGVMPKVENIDPVSLVSQVPGVPNFSLFNPVSQCSGSINVLHGFGSGSGSGCYYFILEKVT